MGQSATLSNAGSNGEGELVAEARGLILGTAGPLTRQRMKGEENGRFGRGEIQGV